MPRRAAELRGPLPLESRGEDGAREQRLRINQLQLEHVSKGHLWASIPSQNRSGRGSVLTYTDALFHLSMCLSRAVTNFFKKGVGGERGLRVLSAVAQRLRLMLRGDRPARFLDRAPLSGTESVNERASESLVLRGTVGEAKAEPSASLRPATHLPSPSPARTRAPARTFGQSLRNTYDH